LSQSNNQLGDIFKIFGNVQSWLSKRISKNDTEHPEIFRCYIKSPIKTILYESNEIQLINKKTFEDEWNEDMDIEYQLMSVDEESGEERPIRAGFLKQFSVIEEKEKPEIKTEPITQSVGIDFEKFFSSFLTYQKQITPQNLQTNVYTSLETELAKRDKEIADLRIENKNLQEKIDNQKEKLQEKIDTQKKEYSEKIDSIKENSQTKINELTLKVTQYEIMLKNYSDIDTKYETIKNEKDKLKESILTLEKQKELMDMEARFKVKKELPSEFEAQIKKTLSEKLPDMIDTGLEYFSRPLTTTTNESDELLESARKLANGIQ